MGNPSLESRLEPIMGSKFRPGVGKKDCRDDNLYYSCHFNLYNGIVCSKKE